MKRKSNSSISKSHEPSHSEFLQSKKNRKSRWSTNEYDKCVIAGMPTTIPPNMNPKDAEVYIIQLQITDITTKLQKQSYTSEIEAMSRLPSPDPIYGNDGKRINTKEYRARERLEDRKKQLMLKLHSLRPDLVPNTDKVGGRYEDKVFIPQDDYPDINLIGLIIGPRGLTLKDLEKEFNAKIIIRGKGSIHNGKVNINSAPLPGEDECLHAYISSYSKESVESAAERIKKIVQEGIDFPELQNDLRKNQMKQLAILNGTYRETDGLNKLKMLNEAQSCVTNTIICSLCGGTGHLPRDCKVNQNPCNLSSLNMPPPQNPQLDGEYKSFMNELVSDNQPNVLPSYLGFPPGFPPPNESAVDGANSFVRKFVFNS